jgi:putative SOS response-associated peptidase YedK
MCGRYVAIADPSQLRVEFETEDVDVPVLPANFNVAPTQPVYVVDELSGPRVLRVVSWGLIPAWAKDSGGAGRLINARSDTINEKPSFRAAFRRTRCLVPARGWYEWHVAGSTKQPYFIQRVDESTAALAGIVEAWRNPQTQEWVRTMSIVTTDASSEIEYVHNRMPVILEQSDWQMWLDPHFGAKPEEQSELQHLLQPSHFVKAHAVAATVNAVRNNGAELIHPME